jgi:hypothetical protein
MPSCLATTPRQEACLATTPSFRGAATRTPAGRARVGPRNGVGGGLNFDLFLAGRVAIPGCPATEPLCAEARCGWLTYAAGGARRRNRHPDHIQKTTLQPYSRLPTTYGTPHPLRVCAYQRRPSNRVDAHHAAAQATRCEGKGYPVGQRAASTYEQHRNMMRQWQWQRGHTSPHVDRWRPRVKAGQAPCCLSWLRLSRLAPRVSSESDESLWHSMKLSPVRRAAAPSPFGRA